MSLIKISQMTSLATATDATYFPVVESGTNKKLTMAAAKSYMVDYPPTSMFYIDPGRTDTYTATGNPNKPFKTIGACYTYIKGLIAASTIPSPQVAPVFMVLCGSITENITLDTGRIYLVGAQGGIHAPIYLTGNTGSPTVTINPSSGDLNSNRFSLKGISVVGASGQHAVKVTGSTPLRMFMEDCWITANASSEVGAGYYQDNTGTGTIANGDTIKISQNGTGDVYCFQILHGSANFNAVETSGATQVGAVSSGATLTFANSELDANGEVCIEAYGTGVLAVTNSTISNASTSDSYGIWLHATGGAALVTNCVIDVASSTSASRMVKGVAGTAFFYKNVMIGRSTSYPFAEHNKKIDSAIGAGIVQITTDSFTTV
jgi:hypothetical protein